MLTDSDSLREEQTVLSTPGFTIHWNTEQPVTSKENDGSSVLVGNNVNRIGEEYNKVLEKQHTPGRPPLWDGNTAKKCLRTILGAS